MRKYFCSILILGRPVMCDTIESPSVEAAKNFWETKFWGDCDDLRDALDGMDEINRQCGERLLALMEATREEAKRHGITVTARPSRAKGA